MENIFIAKNLYKIVKDSIAHFKPEITQGMNKSEIRAFDIGVKNCLYAIEGNSLDEYPVVCLDVVGEQEMTAEEVFEQFEKEI